MYRLQRKVTQKNKVNPKVTDRSCSGRRKIEGNSNITSNRLTVPPGILCLGIKSKTARKSSSTQKSQNIRKQNDLILKEDLHALFNNNFGDNIRKLRRSARISKNSTNTQNLEDINASDYYSKVLNKEKSQPVVNIAETSPILKGPTVRKNKSIFRKINEKYARATKQNNIVLNNFYTQAPSPRLGTSSDTNKLNFDICNINSIFCKNLSRQICIDFKRNSLVDCKARIIEGIQIIDNILSGKIDQAEIEQLEMDKDNRNKNMKLVEDDRDESDNNFEYIPKSQWVYKTPPRQRITLPKVEVCAIQPAVICTTKKQSNIYELNPHMRMDLCNYANRQNIQLDKRYLKHVGTFDQNLPVDHSLETLAPRENSCQTDTEDMDVTFLSYVEDQTNSSSNEFKFAKPSENNVSKHFATLTSRPVKTVKRASRIKNLLKRKLDGFDSSIPDLMDDEQPSCSKQQFQNAEQFENDFTFVGENGLLKLVGTQSLAEDANFNFKFKKNLFKKSDDDKLFNFRKDEPMFDFSQLKKDNC